MQNTNVEKKHGGKDTVVLKVPEKQEPDKRLKNSLVNTAG